MTSEIDNSVVVDQLVRRAMAERRRLKLRLYGLVRVVEPIAYGIRKDQRQLLAYQVAGESRSGELPDWRWIRLERATDLELLDEPFGEARPHSEERHHGWDRLLVSIEG